MDIISKEANCMVAVDLPIHFELVGEGLSLDFSLLLILAFEGESFTNERDFNIFMGTFIS